MFDGRHCTKKDLDWLVEETNKIMVFLEKSGTFAYIFETPEIKNYLGIIARFDIEVTERIQMRIKSSNDINEIKRVIEDNVSTLKQNVIVDIYEHQ